MSKNKSLIIAITDLKNALKVRYVRYSFYGMAVFGPLLVILLVSGSLLLVPESSSEYLLLIQVIWQIGAAFLALMAVVPAGLISANALVGEREQRTLEPLLLTPLTDREIIWGKTLSSLIPCLAILYGGTAVTSIAVYLILIFNNRAPILFPDLAGMFLILVVGPIIVLCVSSTMILVSGRVSRVYEAYQTGSVVVVILMLPLLAPMTQIGSETASPDTVWFIYFITFALAVIVAAVTWTLAMKQFNRDRLVSLV